MNLRPAFTPRASLLELCEALAFAAAYCVGACMWVAAEALLVRGATWAWAVWGEEQQHHNKEALSSLLQCMLEMTCQCSLHQLASMPPFVAWSMDASDAALRGDAVQAGPSIAQLSRVTP
jgi:hypothetical protein